MDLQSVPEATYETPQDTSFLLMLSFYKAHTFLCVFVFLPGEIRLNLGTFNVNEIKNDIIGDMTMKTVIL